MTRLPGSDYARVYLPHGTVAHLMAPFGSRYVLCPAGSRAGEWLGTGSQAEYDRAAALPLCFRCQGTLNRTLPSPERTTMTGVPPSPRVVPVPSPPAASPPSGGGEGTPPLTGKAWRDAVRAATSALHAAQRNRRGKRPGPPVVGVRAAQRPRGEGR